tara:strand:+ start:708 stop:824 length:117 start_codon:yes stop_codon:yes gene_type:complete
MKEKEEEMLLMSFQEREEVLLRVLKELTEIIELLTGGQ